MGLIEGLLKDSARGDLLKGVYVRAVGVCVLAATQE